MVWEWDWRQEWLGNETGGRNDEANLYRSGKSFNVTIVLDTWMAMHNCTEVSSNSQKVTKAHTLWTCQIELPRKESVLQTLSYWHETHILPTTYPQQAGTLGDLQGFSNHGTQSLYWDYAQVAWMPCFCDTCAASGGPWTVCADVLLLFHSDAVLVSSCGLLPTCPAASAPIQTAWPDGQPDSPSSVDVARQVTHWVAVYTHTHIHTYSLKVITFNLGHMVGNVCSQVHILCLNLGIIKTVFI